ncbi:hypothetical protein FOZ63_004550 [Perkinsus olseni]|uniref:Uncharacterized protein n=1 Tax=Perkinsus olseni TaxID=32597 RepID=A0A7J6REQ9_PEROL|nr:hypothetical protein FOZ63_004550 [Perkinsus olseni]
MRTRKIPMMMPAREETSGNELTSEERHHRRALLRATQGMASVSSLTWRTTTDRTTVEGFDRELSLTSSKMDCLSATELRNCSSNAKELRCARRAIEWLKVESKPIQQLPTGEFDHLCAFDFGRSSSDCALPDCCVTARSPEFIECIELFRAHRNNPTLVGLLCQVLAKWCRVPLVGTTGRLESFAKNEDLCDAVSVAGVVARAFSIVANHDNEKVYGAVRNVERSEVIIVGCLDLLASASPELLLRVAWLELEDIGRRSHVDAVESTPLFCRCIVLLTELLKNESEAGHEAGLRCSVEELVNAALDCNFVTWSSDDRQLIKVSWPVSLYYSVSSPKEVSSLSNYRTVKSLLSY